MKSRFAEIEPASLSTRIAELIEESIMSGNIRLGEPINTDDLARQFKVSHIPVREALKRLEATGLIVREANKSARVLDLSEEEVTQILNVRRALEGLAILEAAMRLDGRSKRRLSSLVAKMRETAKSKNYLEMLAADREFHEIIWGLSGNPFLAKSLSNLLLPYFGFLATRGYYANRDHLEYVPRVHQEILDAIASGDGAKAQRVFTAVHDQSMQFYH
jgi:DNA-binding GntR family transcriptional regulator